MEITQEEKGKKKGYGILDWGSKIKKTKRSVQTSRFYEKNREAINN